MEFGRVLPHEISAIDFTLPVDSEQTVVYNQYQILAFM